MTEQDGESEETVDTTDIEESLEAIAGEPEDVEDTLEAILSGATTTVENDGDDGSEDTEADGAEDSEDDETAPDPLELVSSLEGVAVDEDMVEHVESLSAETTAMLLVALGEELTARETELEETREQADDFESRLKRKQADFQNYKKRQKERLEAEKQRATEEFVGRILDVRDNLERALEQDADADIRGGVESTVEQFDEQLRRENVEQIRPEPGESTDPQRHEVLATVESEQPENSIAGVHRIGYEMADKVLRPAQVTVSDGSGDEEQ